jgi:shikimate dehydrogenase
MHMRNGEAQGLRLVYRLIDLTKLGLGVEALPELLTGMERAGFDGLNITHPCKQAVIPHPPSSPTTPARSAPEARTPR